MSKRIGKSIMMLLVVSLCAPTVFGELRAHYTFDDGAGNDSSGNEAHAQPQGSAQVVEDTDLVPGEVFHVIEFNGGDDVLVTPGLTVQERVPALTFATWIKPGEENFDSGLRSLISHRVVPWVDGTIHFMISGRSLRLSVRNDSGLTGTVQFDADQWYHVAVVRDADDMIAYVNGQEDTRVTAANQIIFKDGFNIGAHANASRQFYGRMDDIRIYDHALTADELLAIALAPFPKLELATGPNPVNGETNVPRDVELSWIPGEGANQHDVYFGTNIDDVNNATTTDDPAGVYQGRQAAMTYTPGRLDFGQAYYWRIDEVGVNSTIHKGSVWEFTVEPVGYALSGELVTATASSTASPHVGPENTINGSGLDDKGLHSTQTTDMWLSGSDPNVAWIQYEFDTVYKLHEMEVWNHNTSLEAVVGFGIKDATIEYSTDGANWTTLGTTHEFAKASGAPGYAANTVVELNGVVAKYVKITANSNWGGLSQYGLSEVRFRYIPIWAREPSPESGAKDVDVDVILGFRAGREAAKHDVYLSTDQQAVIDGTAPVDTVTEPSYASSLDLASTYYWRIDEVNDAETPSTWQGDIWNFSTQEYLVVDDFESYNDIPAGEEGSNLVYLVWIDGFDNPSVNGSTIGYTEAFQPSMETSVVYDGKQSVSLFYDNTAATYSEVTANLADLQVTQDWTRHGIKALALQFFGDPTNAVQQMYVKVNGTKVIYDGDAENVSRTGWQMWYIDLVSNGVSFNNVTKLAIGLERIGVIGGQGMVLLDGIRLCSYDRQLVTPVEPDSAHLAVHCEFEGTTNDSSGNVRHGTAMGNPAFEAGKIGQAISLDGADDFVDITGYKGVLGTNAFSITAWIKTTESAGAIVGWGNAVNTERVEFRINDNRLRCQHGAGNVQSDIHVSDGAWHHVALTVIENATISSSDTILWLDGQNDTRFSVDPDAFNITANDDVKIGRRHNTGDWWFAGQMDDVRIYERALTQEEIAWLAGRIKPFDKPF